MAEARRIEGAPIAERVVARVAEGVVELKRTHGVTPGLAVILVGDDPASQIYVKSKGEQSKAAGMHSVTRLLPAETSNETLLAEVQALNADPAVHGILVQSPAPPHIDELAIQTAVDPDKDVDGLNVLNIGRLASARPGLASRVEPSRKLPARSCASKSASTAARSSESPRQASSR